ncbi:hypothetical protein D9758_005625 [Tetrapyrgos nigripes]|uniref:DDE-1 domain-containing protein n=1 Tax=Tetrapyrgos nigripes TaxID=182062 RepID=A0A8H5GGR2_9AGAR|nr:hypothetical protein D9758_005625 [Tetrapyrgos nigripes]
MVGKAVSQAVKDQIASKEEDELKKVAAERYQEEKKQVSEEGGRAPSLRKICQLVSNKHFAVTKRRVLLSHVTVSRLVKGGQTIRDFNLTKCWLTEEEETIVVDGALELARRGFPLSPCHLKENAEGRTVNLYTKEEFYTLLKDVLEKYDIPPELIYGADETGIQPGIGQKEYVLGPKGASIQHQQRSGDRENITLFPTICADGSSLATTIIFKGEAFSSKWGTQENPLDARMSHSKKGYIEGEISIEWIRDFDKQTNAKAAGHARLLLVDGHSTHFTYGFLRYAREHGIHILCYPSHATHVFQGLDVVIFGPLKAYWTYYEAFTPGNIKSAFRKTGVVPYNPDTISLAALAPSLETSSSSQQILPLRLSTSARHVVNLIEEGATQHIGEGLQAITDSPYTTPSTSTRVKTVIIGLQAQSVLRDIHATRLRWQLETKEEKAVSKKTKQINADGKPKLLTSDDVFGRVEAMEKERLADEEAEKMKKDGLGLYKQAVARWEVMDKERRRKNEVILMAYEKEETRWQQENTDA